MYSKLIEQSSPTEYRVVNRAQTGRGFSRTDFNVVAQHLTLHAAQGKYYDLKHPGHLWQPSQYKPCFWTNSK